MKKRLLIFTVILTLLCGTLVAYQALGDSHRGGTVTISREEYDRLAQYAKLDEVLQYIQAYYYQQPDTDAMMDMAVQIPTLSITTLNPGLIFGARRKANTPA